MIFTVVVWYLFVLHLAFIFIRWFWQLDLLFFFFLLLYRFPLFFIHLSNWLDHYLKNFSLALVGFFMVISTWWLFVYVLQLLLSRYYLICVLQNENFITCSFSKWILIFYSFCQYVRPLVSSKCFTRSMAIWSSWQEE